MIKFMKLKCPVFSSIALRPSICPTIAKSRSIAPSTCSCSSSYFSACKGTWHRGGANTVSMTRALQMSFTFHCCDFDPLGVLGRPWKSPAFGAAWVHRTFHLYLAITACLGSSGLRCFVEGCNCLHLRTVVWLESGGDSCFYPIESSTQLLILMHVL